MKTINFIFISGALILLLLVVDVDLSSPLPEPPRIGAVEHGKKCKYVDDAGTTDPANSGKMCKGVRDLECHRAPAKVGTPAGLEADTPYLPVSAEKPDGICVCAISIPSYLHTWVDDGCKQIPEGHGRECRSETGCKSMFKCHVGGEPGEGGKEDKQGTEFTLDDLIALKVGKCVCADGEKKFYNLKECTKKPAGPTKSGKHGEACTDVIGCLPIFGCGVDGAPKMDGTSADVFGTEFDPKKHAGGVGKCACKNGIFKTDKCGAAKDKDEGTNKGKDKTKSSASHRIVYPSSMSFQLAIAGIGSLLLLAGIS